MWIQQALYYIIASDDKQAAVRTNITQVMLDTIITIVIWIYVMNVLLNYWSYNMYIVLT